MDEREETTTTGSGTRDQRHALVGFVGVWWRWVLGVVSLSRENVSLLWLGGVGWVDNVVGEVWV